MATDNSANINDNAQQPKRASGDAGSMEQHSIPDQALGHRLEASDDFVKKKKHGALFSKIRGQGSV